MGILGTKKDSKEKKVDNSQDLSWVIVGPRISEKAAMISANNVFTFDVATAANKIQIKKAITLKYGVTPVSVNVVNQKPRKEMKRGRKVHKKGTKKAMVTLKKGDTIELA
jgi:large subunit ribosomal protein L23